jgi:hypothetical protein
VDLRNTEEGADVSKRDFAGPDCTTWVYDLFRRDTSFGYDVSLQAFVRLQPYGVFARFHGYANHDRFFPGVDLEVDPVFWTTPLFIQGA